MGSTNRTEFYFRPFSTLPETQLVIFLLFLLLYVLSLCGNGAVLLIVHVDHSLHSPMYFFLGNLALLEICYSSTVAPVTLANLLSRKDATISLNGCGTQMFFFVFLGGADCVLLAIMAYDRYVAICCPLRYVLIMSQTVCIGLAASSWLLGFILSLQLTILIFNLPFCGNNEINHFFCDVPVILGLACSDTYIHQINCFIISITVLIIPFLLICISYAFIVVAILQIRSAEGRLRAFSTCSSHLMVVLLQYGCCSFSYLHPSSKYSPEEGRVVAVVYTFITPMLNPLIYSMRNKELKEALCRTLRRVLSWKKLIEKSQSCLKVKSGE